MIQIHHRNRRTSSTAVPRPKCATTVLNIKTSAPFPDPYQTSFNKKLMTEIVRCLIGLVVSSPNPHFNPPVPLLVAKSKSWLQKRSFLDEIFQHFNVVFWIGEEGERSVAMTQSGCQDVGQSEEFNDRNEDKESDAVVLLDEMLLKSMVMIIDAKVNSMESLNCFDTANSFMPLNDLLEDNSNGVFLANVWTSVRHEDALDAAAESVDSVAVVNAARCIDITGILC